MFLLMTKFKIVANFQIYFKIRGKVNVLPVLSVVKKNNVRYNCCNVLVAMLCYTLNTVSKCKLDYYKFNI